ncbi:MAG: hypothetical protein H6923_07805 [Alphaproteobacteria bacterium]|nr:hypothetical protein [Alphaproteobacteria bacterium]
MRKWLITTALIAAMAPGLAMATDPCDPEDPPEGLPSNENHPPIDAEAKDCVYGTNCPYEPTGIDWQDAGLLGGLNEDDKILYVSKFDSQPSETPPNGRQDIWGHYIDDVWASEADGSNTHRLTNSDYSFNHVIVSPDRKLIIANRFVRGNSTGDYIDENENEDFDTGEESVLNQEDFHQAVIIDIENDRMTPIAFIGTTELDAGWGGMAVGPVDSGTGDMSVYFAATSIYAKDIYRVDLTKESDPDEPYSVSGATRITVNLLSKLGYTSPYGDTSPKWVTDLEVSKDGNYMAFLFLGPEMLDDADHSAWKNRIVFAKIDHANNQIDKAAIVSSGGVPTGHGVGGQVWGDFDPDIAPGNFYVTFQRHNAFGQFETSGFSNGDIIRVQTPFLQTWSGWTPDTGYANLSSADPSDDQCQSTNDSIHGIPSWSEGGGGCVIHTVWDEDCSGSCTLVTHARIVNPFDVNTTGEHAANIVTALDGQALHHVQWIPNSTTGNLEFCPTDE